MSGAEFSAADFRAALGHYPTGVSVVTALGNDGIPLALVIGSFTAVSLDPPLVGFLPMRQSRTWHAMAQCPALCINVLANDQRTLCRQLTRPVQDRLDGIAHRRSAQGIALLDGAVLHVECRIARVTEAGDHWFVQCQVDAIGQPTPAAPLVFHRGDYGTILI
jgi:3-hydroxy-9,10-secoandrosta-1,3,5(10)-triene-9,17-dione monooxygenase reductase component